MIYRPIPKVSIAFRPEFLDFERGIRVGNLEDNERITRILRIGLEALFQEPFVTERWGRGVFWQWIGFLSRQNRSAKPISSNVSFGCSKFFVTVDTDSRVFKCGLQVERGFVAPPKDYAGCCLAEDWDWHRLLASLAAEGPTGRLLKRLVGREGFRIFAGSWDDKTTEIGKTAYTGTRQVRELMDAARPDAWAGFQLYYAFDEREVSGMTGLELIESMMAVFREVTPVMNLSTQTILLAHPEHAR